MCVLRRQCDGFRVSQGDGGAAAAQWPSAAGAGGPEPLRNRGAPAANLPR